MGLPARSVMAAPPRARPRIEALSRVTEISAGLVAAGVSIVVLANPWVPINTLILLLAITVGIEGIRLMVTGGASRSLWQRVAAQIGSQLPLTRRLERIGIGAIAVALVVAVLLFPLLRQATLLYLLGFAVVIVSMDRITHAIGPGSARYLQIGSGGAGAVAILLVLGALAVPSLGLATFAILLAVSLLLGGVQDVVGGLGPTDPRQVVLLKLVLFSLFYGLVLINWIDLYGKSVPAYGVWLIFTYFAPFWVLLIYEGFSEWPLALSLGLLVSLANDLGYYFAGNLIFGFHEDLLTWTSGQLGLYGNAVVTTFQAGAFSIPITSWMMGLSIFVRATVVSLCLNYWWRHPGRMVARFPAPRGVDA
jgi:hypothetical protein